MDTYQSKSSPRKSISKALLIRGFSFITVAIVIMAIVWLYMIDETQEQIEDIVAEQNESKAIFSMRESAYQRTLALSRMALLEDEFDQDEEYIKFKEQAGAFIKARNTYIKYLDKDKFPKEFAIWNALVTDINNGQHWQRETINLLLNGEKEQAVNILNNETMPNQDRVMAKLTALLKAQKQNIEATVENTSKQSKSGLYVMGALASWAVLWCIIIATYTIKRTERIEQSLRDSQLKAQNSDQYKSQFLANMSHEIRTPLTAIIGFSETLIEEDKTNDWKSYLHSIIRNGKHLHQLINDILDLSKIEANQLNIEQIPTPIGQVITEINLLMIDRAKNKGLHFEVVNEFPLPQKIISDPTRLKQILINLCSNAIKFTADGRVTLKTRYDKESNLLYFDVEDSGIGMSQDQSNNLFKPFKQAESSTTRKFGGTGLGLYISKLLAKNLGGDLSVKSILGTGSHFTVHIDAGDLTNAKWVYSNEEVLTAASTLHRKAEIPTLEGRILLAEDNPDNQRLIAMQIEKTGAEVEIVENGKLAVERAQEQAFDLILMDMQMPIMGGIEAISTLREKNCTAPIATLTANAMKDDAMKSAAAGANDFLTKPIDRHAFYNVLARYLSPSANTQHPTEITPPRAFNDIPPEVPNIATQKATITSPLHDDHLDDISDLIDHYVRQLPETSYRIERLLSAKEWGELTSEIHQLKGTGGAFGFPEITSQCADIEEHMAKKDFAATTQSIAKLNITCTNIAKMQTG